MRCVCSCTRLCVILEGAGRSRRTHFVTKVLQCHLIDLILVLLASLCLYLFLVSPSLSPPSLNPTPSPFPRQHVAIGYITAALTACVCACVCMRACVRVCLCGCPWVWGNQTRNVQLSALSSLQAHASALLMVLTLIALGAWMRPAVCVLMRVCSQFTFAAVCFISTRWEQCASRGGKKTCSLWLTSVEWCVDDWWMMGRVLS